MANGAGGEVARDECREGAGGPFGGDEGPGGEGVMEGAGHGAAVAVHAMDDGGVDMSMFSGGAEWTASIEQIPAAERHLALGRGSRFQPPPERRQLIHRDALLESLEGKRGNPRIKPPFPAVVGLYGSPTVVNNVETLAAAAWIVQNGGEEYAKIGIGKSTGTKLISASGNINNPGVYEIEMSITVEEFLYSDQWCGGIKNGKKLKACVPGGSSVPILPHFLVCKTANGEDRMMTYESLADGGFATGSMLGSGGFIVYDENQCIVRNSWDFARFYAHESCGQCSPCREGTGLSLIHISEPTRPY